MTQNVKTMKIEDVADIVIKINICRKIALFFKYLFFVIERTWNITIVSYWHAVA